MEKKLGGVRFENVLISSLCTLTTLHIRSRTVTVVLVGQIVGSRNDNPASIASRYIARGLSCWMRNHSFVGGYLSSQIVMLEQRLLAETRWEVGVVNRQVHSCSDTIS